MNIETDTSQKTKKLLLSILEYCSSNNLVFWKDGVYFNKFYVASEKEYKEANKNKNQYSPDLVEVNQKIINDGYYNMGFGINSTNNRNTSISPISAWAFKNQKQYNELYVHVFWSNEKEIAQTFAESWLIKESLNLANAIEYSTKEYQDGFSDSKLTPYSLGKNWWHFLDTIRNNNLVNFWENYKNFEQFHNALKTKKENGFNPHSYLATLTDRLCEYGISEDSKLRSSYMIMDVIPEHLQMGYVEKFPFVQSLMNDFHRESLFLQSDEEMVEKVIFPKSHIYKYFNNKEIDSSEYISLSIEALTQLSNSKELKDIGLISVDIVENEDIVTYLTLSKNKNINKHEFKSLFIKVLDSYISNIEDINTKYDSNTLMNKLFRDGKNIYLNVSVVEELTNAAIRHWVLERASSKFNSRIAIKKKNEDLKKHSR